jgi:hypothetical protein
MEPVFIAALLVPPFLFLLLAAAFAYVDAPDHGMDPVKWAALSFFVPFFGFFAYLFEREERKPSPDRDMFSDCSVFEIHESRAGETLVEEGGPPEDDGDDEDHAGPERDGLDR